MIKYGYEVKATPPLSSTCWSKLMTAKESTTKTCKRCFADKPLCEFSPAKKPADRLSYWCKSCSRIASRDYRKRNKEKCKAATRKRNKLRTRLDLSKYPERNNARSALYRAIKCGSVTKEIACSGCGESGKIEGHHVDYSKPLDVIWLCTGCHGYVHYMDRFKLELELN